MYGLSIVPSLVLFSPHLVFFLSFLNEVCFLVVYSTVVQFFHWLRFVVLALATLDVFSSLVLYRASNDVEFGRLPSVVYPVLLVSFHLPKLQSTEVDTVFSFQFEDTEAILKHVELLVHVSVQSQEPFVTLLVLSILVFLESPSNIPENFLPSALDFLLLSFVLFFLFPIYPFDSPLSYPFGIGSTNFLELDFFFFLVVSLFFSSASFCCVYRSSFLFLKPEYQMR